MTTPHALPAGPELDRLVAERVMGWESCVGGLQAKGSKDPAYYRVNGKERSHASWSPSTNIAHAWEVVTRLGQLGAVVSVIVHPIGSKLKPNVIITTETTTESYDIEGDTAPHAICRAAILATEQP